MGETWDIVCDECRVRLWVAQDMYANPGKPSFFLFGRHRAVPGGDYSPLAEFLFDHQGHPLRLLPASVPDERSIEYLILDKKPCLDGVREAWSEAWSDWDLKHPEDS